MELRCAKRIKSHDDHALIGLDNALAAGATPESLGLTPDEIHQARVRFVKHELMRYIFEQSEKYFSNRSRVYILLGVVEIKEVSVRPEDRRILGSFADSVRTPEPGPQLAELKETIQRAVANSQDS